MATKITTPTCPKLQDKCPKSAACEFWLQDEQAGECMLKMQYNIQTAMLCLLQSIAQTQQTIVKQNQEMLEEDVEDEEQ